jgi:hypothetical protein
VWLKEEEDSIMKNADEPAFSISAEITYAKEGVAIYL